MTTPNSTLKPITLYGAFGPNPTKVQMILEELGLPYTIDPVPFSAVKQEPYTSVNPNGRLPSIHDPNTNLTLWESGAIIEYLIDKYDPAHTLSFPPGSHEFYLTKQWLHFQVSGQGPYYGQAGWFKKFHHENLPSALTRYINEVKRVCGVLESWLEKQKSEHPDSKDGPWLVGGKLTYVDIAWVQWQRIIQMALSKEEFDDAEFPLVKEWMGRLVARDSVRKVIEATDPK